MSRHIKRPFRGRQVQQVEKNEQFHLLKISPLSPNSGNENLNLQENKWREKEREREYTTRMSASQRFAPGKTWKRTWGRCNEQFYTTASNYVQKWNTGGPCPSLRQRRGLGGRSFQNKSTEVFTHFCSSIDSVREAKGKKNNLCVHQLD